MSHKELHPKLKSGNLKSNLYFHRKFSNLKGISNPVVVEDATRLPATTINAQRPRKLKFAEQVSENKKQSPLHSNRVEFYNSFIRKKIEPLKQKERSHSNLFNAGISGLHISRDTLRRVGDWKKSHELGLPGHSLPRVKLSPTPDVEPHGIENFIKQQAVDRYRASYLKKAGVSTSLSDLLGIQRDVSETSLPKLDHKHLPLAQYHRKNIVHKKSRQPKLFIPGMQVMKLIRSKSQQFLQGHSQSVMHTGGGVIEDKIQEMESNESSLESDILRLQPRHERYVLVLYQGLKIAKPITRLIRFLPNPPMVDNAEKSKNLNTFLNKINTHFKDLAGPVRHLFLQDGKPIVSLDQIKPDMKFIYAGCSPHFYGIQSTLLSGRLRKEISGVLSQELALVQKLRNRGLKNKFLKSFNFKSSFSKPLDSDKQVKVWDALQQFEYDEHRPLAAEADQLLNESIQCLPDEEERARLMEMYKPALLKKRAVFYSSNKGKIMDLKKQLMNKQTLDFNDSELFSREESVQKFNIIVEESESRRLTDSNRFEETSGRLTPIKVEHNLQILKQEDSTGDFSVNYGESESRQTPSHRMNKSIVLPLLDDKSQLSAGKKSQQNLSSKSSLLPLRRKSTIVSKWDHRFNQFDDQRNKEMEISFQKQRCMRSSILNSQVKKEVRPMGNMIKLVHETGLSRSQLFDLHSKFKVLSKMTAFNRKKLDVRDGVDFDAFRNAMKELQLESKSLAYKIFTKLKDSHREFMNWESFLRAYVQLKSVNIEKKLNLFLKVIDTDGNGLLSYDEVLDICRKSLKRFTKNEDSSTKNLAEYFTTLVFKALGRDFEEEIPLEDVKNAILKEESDDRDILALFCGVEGLDEVDTFTEDDFAGLLEFE